jgi:multidrug resistance protein, MATE family
MNFLGSKPSPQYPDADRRIWRIAGPSILSNLSGALVGIVDVWAIGHLSDEAALAGLAVGAFVMTTIYMTFSFLYMSTIGLVAQSFGANRSRKIIEIVLRACVIGVCLGLIVIACAGFIASASIAIWQASDKTSMLTRVYLDIRLWNAPALFVSMCVSGFLIGTQRARLALYLQLFLNALNAVLVLWFVLGLGLGVAGAAIGTLIAEWSAALAGIVVVMSILRPARALAVVREGAFWRIRSFGEQLAINGFLLARTLIIQLVFAILSVSGARFGDSVLAANHLLLQLVLVTSLGLVGMGSATQALIGQAKGLAKREAFYFWSLRTGLWSFFVALAFAAAYGLPGTAIIAAFTDVENIRAAANQQMVLIAIWPLVAAWSYQFEAIFIGATGAKQMMWSAAFAACVFIVAWWQLAPVFGNTGLWIAFTMFFAARAASLALCYPSLARSIPQAEPRSGTTAAAATSNS